jgi:adenylate cyclase
MSRLPSAPHCEACGSPFGGVGGRIMRRMGKGPSRKNPRWCELCFEKSPGGGATLTVGVLFADLRNSTALAERTSPRQMADLLNRFYSDTTKVIVQHGIVDKLIGDEVMGVYIPALTPGGRFVDALVADARLILRTAGYGGRDQPRLELGIGLAVGPAFVGHVGDGEVRDFTAIGDAVNTAARLQALAAGGEIVATEDVARQAGVDPSDGEARVVEVRGKAEPVAVRVLTASVLVG